ncbi:hypothetical protein [uncultured Pontibacter sp.]|uniref:hypothetical protein n=1 Tax=uncultured Pontibacter sp. TaxID=453356 RepID=UPI002610F264|nr:hypothetical protein [uncultured Pontibacter sp.]
MGIDFTEMGGFLSTKLKDIVEYAICKRNPMGSDEIALLEFIIEPDCNGDTITIKVFQAEFLPNTLTITIPITY